MSTQHSGLLIDDSLSALFTGRTDFLLLLIYPVWVKWTGSQNEIAANQPADQLNNDFLKTLVTLLDTPLDVACLIV